MSPLHPPETRQLYPTQRRPLQWCIFLRMPVMRILTNNRHTKNKNHHHSKHCFPQNNNHHPVQKSVTIWARIVNIILDLEGTSQPTPVNTFFNKTTNRLELIKSTQILYFLQWACNELGPDHLGYSADEIRCHSIRSGVAMAMYLRNVKTFIIMLQGRWISDAFLRYIRK